MQQSWYTLLFEWLLDDWKTSLTWTILYCNAYFFAWGIRDIFSVPLVKLKKKYLVQKLTLSTCIFLNDACNTLKFWIYSCSNLVLNLTFFNWTQSRKKNITKNENLLIYYLQFNPLPTLFRGCHPKFIQMGFFMLGLA